MDILSIPFHRFLNIEKSPVEEGYIFRMEEHPEHLNHLGTLHACAQLALAEASSGEFLLQQFGRLKDSVIPVIRKTEVKYSKPANGTLHSKASYNTGSQEEYLKEYLTKNRCFIPVRVELFDSSNSRTASAVFHWFLTKNEI